MCNSSDSEKEDLNIDFLNTSTSSKLNKVTLETLHEGIYNIYKTE